MTEFHGSIAIELHDDQEPMSVGRLRELSDAVAKGVAGSATLAVDDRRLDWSIQPSRDTYDATAVVATCVEAVAGALRDEGLEPETYEVVKAAAITPSEARREARSVSPVVGAAEVTELLGLSRSRFYELQKSDVFPDPLTELRAGPVWRREDILEFKGRERRAGRPRRYPEATAG